MGRAQCAAGSRHALAWAVLNHHSRSTTLYAAHGAVSKRTERHEPQHPAMSWSMPQELRRRGNSIDRASNMIDRRYRWRSTAKGGIFVRRTRRLAQWLREAHQAGAGIAMRRPGGSAEGRRHSATFNVSRGMSLQNVFCCVRREANNPASQFPARERR